MYLCVVKYNSRHKYMKTKVLTLTILTILVVISACSPKDAEENLEYDLETWMSCLSDTTRVCKLSIPGTHDALTAEGFTDPQYINDYTTQVATFDEQLKGGIRYFDIRLVMSMVKNTIVLQTAHRTATIKLTFEDVLNKAQKFLTDNPSEFLIMKIQYDGGFMSNEDKSNWINAIQKILSDKHNAKYFCKFRPDIKVKDLRGKILFVSRTNYGNPVYGALTNWTDEGTDNYVRMDSIAERTLTLAPCPEAAIAYNGANTPNAARLYVQDFYNTIGTRMEAKLNAVKAMFLSSQQVGYNENVWILNHVSGYSTPKMNAIGYAENASKTNALLLHLLNEEKSSNGIGIIAMDFACIDTLNKSIGTLGQIERNVMSRSLTRAIIDRNMRTY